MSILLIEQRKRREEFYVNYVVSTCMSYKLLNSSNGNSCREVVGVLVMAT